MARWCDVRVEVFSLGFGKKIFKFKKGDTTYAISMIPLGGYVKMFGDQNGDQIPEEERKVSFTHKNVYQRIAIVLAGPIMNFLFAVVVFFAIAMMGEEAKMPIVGDILDGSPAYVAGFRSGDKILSINQKPINTWEDVQRSLSLKENQDLHLDVTVNRENSTEATKVALTAKAEQNPNPLSTFDYVANIEGLNSYSLGTTVGVLESSPLKALGMKTGDTIVSINGQKVNYWRQLEPVLAAQNAKNPLTLEIVGKRDDESREKPMTVTMAALSSVPSFSLKNLGLESSELYLSKVMEDSPAEAAGLLAGDRLTKINGAALTKWEDVINSIKSSDGQNPARITVLRDGKNVELSITPKMTKQMLPTGVEEKRYTIGIAPIANIAPAETMVVHASGIGSALGRGVQKTWEVSVMTVMSFVRLFQGQISPKNVGGVISIGQAASETFKIGINPFLQMMAIISVNLFVLNLLPIPVLDGGHLVFYVIEMVKGAPLSIRKMEMAQQVGLAILMSLMIFALFNDFTRLLGL